MKRSEMCKIIEDYMTGLRHNATANTLLEIIENAGMTPPLEPYRRVEDCDLGLPQWEPEEYEGSKYDPEGEWGE